MKIRETLKRRDESGETLGAAIGAAIGLLLTIPAYLMIIWIIMGVPA